MTARKVRENRPPGSGLNGNQHIDIIDAVLATSGRSWTMVERAQRIIKCYKQLITPLDELPPLPQLPTQPKED